MFRKRIIPSNFTYASTDNQDIKMRILSLVFGLLILCATQINCNGLHLTGGTEVGSPSISEDPDNSSTDGGDDETDSIDDVDVSNSITTLSFGIDGDISVSARKQYITSQGSLQTAWEGLFPSETAPVVDFSQYTVVFIVMGAQSDSGTWIEVTNIEIIDLDFNIYLTETTSGSGCQYMQVISNPYHIVLIDKNSASLRRHFITETEEESCEE